MNNNIFEDLKQIIKKKLQNRRWRQAVTFFACAVVFSTTYALILPAITMSAQRPALAAEELEAMSGETLSVRVEVGAEDEDRLILLSAESVGADLAGKYIFNKEGIALILDEDGREFELHRTPRNDDIMITDYWFELPAGESTAFTLELEDKFDPERYGEAKALARSTQAGETATASNAEKEEAGTASPSDAERQAPAATASNAASKATASNADVLEANEIASDGEQEQILTEVNDEGFLEILDGAVVNDLETDGEEEDEEEEKVAAVLKLSAGSGSSLEEAIVDVKRNADKREGARLAFVWKVDLAALPDMMWTGDGVRISVRYGEDAWIPEDAVFRAREIREDEDGEDDYESILLRAKETVDKADAAAGAATDAAAEDAAENAGSTYRDIVRVRFFELEILSADGNRILPEAPVEVKMHFDEPFAAAEENSLETVILTEEDAAVIRAEKDPDEAGVRELRFEYGGSAVIGIAELKAREARSMSAEGEDYSITVRYGAEAGLPEDAALQAAEIPAGSREYEELKKNAAEILGETRNPATVTFARFFRLTILSGETALDPAEAAAVELCYREADGQRIENLSAVLFADGGGDVIKAEALAGNAAEAGSGSEGEEEKEEQEAGENEGRKLDGISFRAARPILVGVVEAPKQQDLGKLRAKYGHYVVRLGYDDESGIPEDTCLNITEYEPDEEEWDRIFKSFSESCPDRYISVLKKMTAFRVEPVFRGETRPGPENKAYLSVQAEEEPGEGECFFGVFLTKDSAVVLDLGEPGNAAEIGAAEDGYCALLKLHVNENPGSLSEPGVGLEYEEGDENYTDPEEYETLSGEELEMDLETEETGEEQ